jgi:hypothetical protein
LAQICAAVERAAFLTFDIQGLEGWLQFHEGLRGLGDDGRLRISAGRAWAQVMKGQLEAATESLQEVKKRARAEKVASCLIDAEATLALVLLAMGWLEQAVEVARRASRMAVAEELPHGRIHSRSLLGRLQRHGQCLATSGSVDHG